MVGGVQWAGGPNPALKEWDLNGLGFIWVGFLNGLYMDFKWAFVIFKFVLVMIQYYVILKLLSK